MIDRPRTGTSPWGVGGRLAALFPAAVLLEGFKGLIRRTIPYEVKILLVMVTITGPDEMVFREEARPNKDAWIGLVEGK
jgi:hypothetical protein